VRVVQGEPITVKIRGEVRKIDHNGISIII
jgi:hypothetical protein